MSEYVYNNIAHAFWLKLIYAYRRFLASISEDRSTTLLQCSRLVSWTFLYLQYKRIQPARGSTVTMIPPYRRHVI